MRYEGTMVITSELSACSDFYETLLGVSPDHGAGWAQFTLADGSIVALHTPWREGMSVQGGSQVLLLRVDSLTDEAERLSAAGIAVSEPHDIPGGAVVTLADPDGRTIQLLERSSE